jgi:hypothetical protein
MSAQLRNLMGAGLVAAWMLFPAIGDDPSAGARALLGHVGATVPASAGSVDVNPFYPSGDQALLGRVGGSPRAVETRSQPITGEQAILARGR